MTEHQLKSEAYSIVLHRLKAKRDADYIRDAVVRMAKAYADAETKELEEDYAELKMIHDKFYESDAVQHKQILALNTEIKRLREVAQRARQYCEYGNGCGGATKLPSGEWFDEGEGTLYHAVLSVLSPAPVTEGDHENGLPTDDEIHFVAVDESNADRHGWISLNQKPAYVDGFEDGAKWMRNKKTT